MYFYIALLLWWIDPGWTSGVHQKSSLPLSWTGERSLWVKVRTQRDHSPTTVTGKTESTWGN